MSPVERLIIIVFLAAVVLTAVAYWPLLRVLLSTTIPGAHQYQPLAGLP